MGSFVILSINDGVTPESRGFGKNFGRRHFVEKHVFKTAEFAALCGVKKDTLLHYDHIGLLKPQWVGENGYRYYSARQLPVFDLIATLRRLDTPLGEIREYLDCRSPQALLELLEEKEEALNRERRRLDRMGALLQDTRSKALLASQVQPGEIHLETCPELWCAVIEAPDFSGQGFQEAVYLLHVRQLLAWAREQGSASQAPGDIFCRESLEQDKFLEDYYYCIVPPGTTGWEIRIRPAGTYAVLYHQGPYSSEYSACRRLRDWVLDQGYEIDGDLYEEDLANDFVTEDPQSYLFKLSLKIRTP